MTDYNSTISCPVTVEDAYKAITERMSEWWTPMSAKFLKVDDKAKTGFGGDAYWMFRAKTLTPFSLIELECCEANYIHPDMSEDMREEWLDTTLRFEISGQVNQTTIDFTHVGLTPEMGCFDVCRGGWDHYIPGSLAKYLSDKGGAPNTY